MTRRTVRVVLCIYGWWGLLVLPAVLTLAGVFGDVGPESELDGAIVIAWIVGYLAQFAMIWAIGWAVGHTRVWWFFVASLLPWVVDWGTPLGVGMGILLISASALLASVLLVTSLRSVNLDENGRLVTATVVKVLPNRMNVVINNVYLRRKVLLDIPNADGTTTQAVLPMLCEIGTSPDPGDKLRVRVDPNNPNHIALAPTSQRDER